MSINCLQTSIHSTPRRVKQLPKRSNLKTETPEPNPQSQSFSRSCRSRLPTSLPTLFCGLEAANFGDMMRSWVRSGVDIILSFGFSTAVRSASDTTNDKVLYQPMNLIARQAVFRLKKSCLKEKTTLPEAPTCLAEFLHATIRYPRPGWRILTPFPFKIRGKACVCGTPMSFRIA